MDIFFTDDLNKCIFLAEGLVVVVSGMATFWTISSARVEIHRG